MRQYEHDVVVAGAGPVGLLLSIELARRGTDVCIIDSQQRPLCGSKGKGIQPRTQELLEHIGILDEFLAIGGRYPPIRLYKSDGIREEPYALRLEPTRDCPYPNILMVPQAQTEAILRKRLAALGRSVLVGHELTSFKQHDDGITAQLVTDSRTRMISARYLIGADGGRSVVRHLLGIPFAGETLPRRAIFADVRANGLPVDVWHRWPDAPGGQISLCPLLGTNLFQMAAEVSPNGTVDLSVRAVVEMIRTRLSPQHIDVTEIPWYSLMRVNLRLAQRYRERRVFLAGDAAHIHPPTGAQGLNTGVQDAFNLGWKLAAVLQGADSSLLDSYEMERRPVAVRMLELSGVLLGAWQDQKKIERGTLTSQIDVHYRDSPLAVALGEPKGTLRPGDRAPDAPCQDSHGREIRLFELLRVPGFKLLGYGVASAQLASLIQGTNAHAYSFDSPLNLVNTSFVDHHGAIQQSYGLNKDDVVLIRPDGYVAAFAGKFEREQLRTLLLHWSPLA